MRTLIIHWYQGIILVTKWHTIQVDAISTRPISVIFSVHTCKFRYFHVSTVQLSERLLLYFILGGTMYHGKDQFWGNFGHPGANLNTFCLQVTCQEIPTSWNIDFWMFLVTSFEEKRRNRCSVVSQPTIYIKTYRSTAPTTRMLNHSYWQCVGHSDFLRRIQNLLFLHVPCSPGRRDSFRRLLFMGSLHRNLTTLHGIFYSPNKDGTSR